MAKATRISSRTVLPGSFWCELFTYRTKTADPGIEVMNEDSPSTLEDMVSTVKSTVKRRARE
jgi:hypothetical protein